MNTRDPGQIREHYEVEKRLASRLRRASPEDRGHLYTLLYDELFHQVPHHPQLTQKRSPELQRSNIRLLLRIISPYLKNDTTFLEIGAGDCALVFEVCKQVKFGYAVDVSETITYSDSSPENFRMNISNGIDIPVPRGEIDFAFSNQLMEHLHPDDALEQLKNIYDCLKPGGVYLCITPNRLDGPHDVSRGFDEVASGFHLKEYSVSELTEIFTLSGFRSIRMISGIKGRFIQVPVGISTSMEFVLEKLSNPLRRRISAAPLVRHLIYPRILATK